MSIQCLKTLLQTYHTTYPDESGTVKRYIEFITNHADCFERTQPAGHVTGSAWLVNTSGTHVLLTHHRKLDRWLQLGGHADGQTNILEVALKEAREESGIQNILALNTQLLDIDIHEIPPSQNEPAHYHYDARFTLQVAEYDTFTVSNESHALEWVNIFQLAERTSDPSILRMAHKWLLGKT